MQPYLRLIFQKWTENEHWGHRLKLKNIADIGIANILSENIDIVSIFKMVVSTDL